MSHFQYHLSRERGVLGISKSDCSDFMQERFFHCLQLCERRMCQSKKEANNMHRTKKQQLWIIHCENKCRHIAFQSLIYSPRQYKLLLLFSDLQVFYKSKLWEKPIKLYSSSEYLNLHFVDTKQLRYMELRNLPCKWSSTAKQASARGAH